MIAPKLSFKTVSLAKPAKARLFTACAALLLAAFAAHPAAAKDTAPAWLHDLAQAPLPTHESDAVAIVLLDDTEISIQNDGNTQTVHRRAVKLLRPEGRGKFASLVATFDHDTKISYMRAWTITSDGRDLAVTDKDAVDRGYLDDILYTDAKDRVLSVPEANPGCVIGYEWATTEHRYLNEVSWIFQQTVPVKHSRLDLRLPPSWEFTTKWFNYAETKATDTGTEHVWEMNDIPAIHTEPSMPPFRSVAGWMGVKYSTRSTSGQTQVAATWKDIGVWYNGLTQTSRNSTPAIHQKVADLTSGSKDALAQMRAITEYMQRQVRYFGVEVGIGGYQPHNAADIFTHQYGDCKDKATLLSAMLKEIGIDSYYLVVDAYREGVHPDYPAMNFDHMILAIRLPDNVSDDTLYSVVQDPKLGKLLIFDPTNEYVPLGYIPYYEQNTYGLLVAPDGGELISLPVAPPTSNRLLRSGQLSLSQTGALTGEVRELRWGSAASEEREEYMETQPAKRAQILERLLQRSLPNFVLTGATLGDLEQINSNLVVDYKFVAQGYARMAGDELLLRPAVILDEQTNALDLFTQGKPRKYGIEFESEIRQDDTYDITVPDGYKLEGEGIAANFTCDFATYSIHVEQKGNLVHYGRTLQIEKVHVPDDKLAELQDFLTKVAANQAMYMALREEAPGSASR